MLVMRDLCPKPAVDDRIIDYYASKHKSIAHHLSSNSYGMEAYINERLGIDIGTLRDLYCTRTIVCGVEATLMSKNNFAEGVIDILEKDVDKQRTLPQSLRKRRQSKKETIQVRKTLIESVNQVERISSPPRVSVTRAF